MPVSRLTAVVLYVAHVAASAAFYRDSLGAAPLFDYGEADAFQALRLGDIEIHLHTAPAADDQLASTWPAGAAGGVGVALHIHASDLARRGQLIQRAGGRVLQEASLQPWGTIELIAADPDGYRLLLWEGQKGLDIQTW